MASTPPHPDNSRQVPCPGCGQPSAYGPGNKWRPFCSQRCRSLDLGAWASERYRVPAKPGDGPDQDDGTAPPGTLNH